MLISRTPFYIELLDGTGKKSTGYLAGVGADTLGSEKLTNPTFDVDTTGWYGDNGTIASIAGGQSGKCCELTYVSSPCSLRQDLSGLAIGELYKLSRYVKSGTSGNENTRFQLYADTGYEILVDAVSSGSWVSGTGYGTVKGTTLLLLVLWKIAAGAGTMLFDEVSLKRVTDPPSTGVHIVSSFNGTVRNWASIESGFDPNNIASWKLYDLAHPGMYLPSDGSTFNRGDFTADNAFFWSSIDLSPYAGTLTSSDSLRQTIISAVDTRLKTILIANGYKTDMGQNVFEWKTDPFQTSEIDGLSYRDRTEERTAGCGVYDLVMPLEIEMISDSPAGIRKCLADLEKAVFVDETWGSLAWYTEFRTNEMAVEKKENLFSASKIVLKIEYRTGRGNADTQI